MSRKTAIRITSAEIAAEQFKADARRDAAPVGAAPSTLGLMRAARGMISERELMRLADSAARLEMRGDQFDAEDRKDCAAELVWHILAETGGSPPRRDSRHATLTYLCGLARNWRRSLVRRRATEDRARAEAEDRYALSPAAMLEAIDAREFDAAYLEAAREQAIDAAHAIAADAIDRLELTHGGPVHAAFYQWARAESGEVCAAENGVNLSAWKMRVKRGAEMIRAAYPDPADLLEAIAPSDPPAIYRGVSLDWRAREGTNNGAAPVRPESGEDARALCLMRHQCPVPGLGEINASRMRRGYLVPAPMIRSRGERAPRGFLFVPGRSAAQARADSLRKLAAERARSSSRERGVSPVKVDRMAAA